MGKQGKKNASSKPASNKVALLDSNDWLSAPLLKALQATFQRFDADGDGMLCVAELQAFARACNYGDELDEDELEQIQQYFDTDHSGKLTLKGFHEMYHMQTKARPKDTWKDMRALGFDGTLELAGAAVPAARASWAARGRR